MKKLDEKRWRRFAFILQDIFIIIAVILGDVVAVKFFDDSFGKKLIFCVLFAIILTPLRVLIEGVVEQSEFLRKPFEKDEEGE